MGDDDDLASLQRQRGNVKRNITNIRTKVERDGATCDPAVLQCRLEIVEAYFKQLTHIQNDIEKLSPQDAARSDLEDVFISTKAKIISFMPNRSDLSFNNSSSIQLAPTRLPNLKLPKFDGRYAEYKRFYAAFEHLVHNDSSLTKVDKFNYLLNCLSGPALAVIESFQVTDQNYDLAIARLKARYDNKVLIFQEHIAQIFNAPVLNKPNAGELRKLIDTTSALFSSLSSLGSEKDIMNSLMVHILLSKLDPDSRNYYNEKQEFTSLPTWDDCYKVLDRRCQYLEANAPATTTDKSSNQRDAGKHQGKKGNKVFLTTNESCTYCTSTEHTIRNCQEFNTLHIPQRISHAKSAGLCLNCLRKGHFANKCSSSARCRTCKELHHTLLHKAVAPPTADTTITHPVPSSTSTSTQPQVEQVRQSFLIQSRKRTILPTAVVMVKDKWNQWQPVRAYLDSCSETNMMTEEIAKMLQLRRKKTTQEVTGIGKASTRIESIVDATVKSRLTEFSFTGSFSITSCISSKQPAEYIDYQQWKIPDGVQLADPAFFKPSKIDILLSAEVFFEILLYGKISLGPQLPPLTNTVFGWIVGGKLSAVEQPDQVSCNVLRENANLDSIVQRFWEIENYATIQPGFSEEEQRCEEHFLANVSTTAEGRVQVRLPFKHTAAKLGASYNNALRRFLAVERRLNNNSELKEKYVQFMEEYIQLGHMSLATHVDHAKPHFFVPHHCVVQPSSTTTKLRVVFDGSAKTSSGFSINDLLMVGPTIQQDLITTLFAFRLHKFALTADVVKMFRQFLIEPRDKSFQLIIWRTTANEPYSVYTLNTVTYGYSAAPYLAIRALFFIAELHEDKFPIGAKVIREDTYVDDTLTGADTIEDLQVRKRELESILKLAGLELAKFNSNSNKVVQSSNNKITIKTDESEIAKALGLQWLPKSDIFSFEMDFLRPIEFTKRSILSQTARIFDLLGLLSPITIKCKILLQELWIRQLEWDDQIPEDLQNLWSIIHEDLININRIEVPRYVLTTVGGNTQIHGFSDASERAYGCCFYARTEENGTFKTVLLIAKGKVAPIKAQSLPRLELCGALLLARVWVKIREKLAHRISSVHFWTDSKIVLHWLQMHSSQLQCFVANRVAELQSITHNIKWRHVPGKCNPADIVSRGCSASELPHTSWFSGPEFLKFSEEFWPPQLDITAEPIELRKRAVFVTILQNPIVDDVINKCSSYYQALRIFCFVFRCANRVRANRNLHAHNVIQPTAMELNHTFWQIISIIQHIEYKSEIECLQHGKPVSHSLQKLSPFLHEMQINNKTVPVLRVGGRLQNANISFEAKFPALVPRTHRFVLLYVEFLHKKHLHAGQKVLLALVREKLWVVNLRHLVRKVVRSCIHCFHYKPKLMTQIMGSLPANRLRSERPFLVSGVDFCGPFYTSYKIRGKPPYKTYVAIFICFASKAVHIEPVSELSTNAFLLCLKRFASRRGIPKQIFCDNATNFVGAKAKLAEFQEKFLHQEVVNNINTYCASSGIEFCFIPPRAPHFGGLWEAAVKSAKTLLVKNISEAYLTFEELLTLLTEVEAILNSRPICTSDDPNDGEVLTPAHLLIGSSLLAPPDDIIDPGDDKRISYLSRWQRVTFFKNQFWQIWRRDYIHLLQERAKWTTTKPNIAVGQLVLVHEDNTPPQQWPMARITAAIPGKDGKVRVVDVTTEKGSFRRPICKIAPLPVGGDSA